MQQHADILVVGHGDAMDAEEGALRETEVHCGWQSQHDGAHHEHHRCLTQRLLPGQHRIGSASEQDQGTSRCRGSERHEIEPQPERRHHDEADASGRQRQRGVALAQIVPRVDDASA